MELKELSKEIKKFNKNRNWDEKIQPEDIAKSIIIESAELLEHFQWDATRKKRGSEKQKDVEKLADEMADVLIYLLRLSYILDIDLEDAVLKKIEKNSTKYPLD